MSEGVSMPSYPAIVPYLLVEDAKTLIAFLESGFAAKTRMAAPSETGGVMHAELELGDGLIMLSDASNSPRAPTHLCHYVKDVDATYQTALAAGAASQSEPKNQDYGQRIAGITDTAGNTWWICAELT